MLCQHDTTQKNSFTLPPRPGNAPFGASPSPTLEAELKTENSSSFDLLNYIFLMSPLEVDGPGAPPPSSVPCALAGAQPSCSHARVLPTSITCKTNNDGTTRTCTFVVTPHGCGFHPSNVDGLLIRNTLATYLRF